MVRFAALPQDTKAKIIALEVAKSVISRGRGLYLCIVLNQVGDRNPGLRQATSALRNYIRHALNEGFQDMPCRVNSLDWWKKFKGITGHGEREDRIAWIDWMIDSLTKYPDGIGPEHPMYKPTEEQK